MADASLGDYARLAPKSAVALVRAARLFQNGLWLCESSPNDAWLMLVSAAEVAAVEWRAIETENQPENLLRKLKPNWVVRLEKTGGAGLVADMAKEWADLLGSTNRFLKFLESHLPDAPTERPPVAQVDWSKKTMREALTKVYEYRSSALHAGVPFPGPMCQPPTIVSTEHSTPTERPIGLASASSGGVWKGEDMPMHLHIFAFIVRGSLLKWWRQLTRIAVPFDPSAV